MRDERERQELSGAARTSFVKKCEADTAKSTCDAEAADKKLAGAARTSFLKKCVVDRATERCASQAADTKLSEAVGEKTNWLSFFKKPAQGLVAAPEHFATPLASGVSGALLTKLLFAAPS